MAYSEGDIIKAVSSGNTRSILLIGGPDTGKTAMAGRIFDRLSMEGEAGALDLDTGQSHIGPPATMAWGLVKNGFRGWEEIAVEGFYFTGALSPPGNLVPSLTGAKLLMDEALRRCERIIIDTSGLVTGSIGRIYKQYKIELLSPDVVVGIEREDELGHILDAYRFQSRPRVLRVRVPPRAVPKSAATRAEWRAKRFREYFRDAREIVIETGSVGLRFTKEDGEGLGGRLLSLRDDTQRDLALGYIVEDRLEKGRLVVRSPLPRGAAFTTIIIGAARALF
ncbi:MAG: hypothetical protein K8I01_13095 [Candidatus Methylomirabilis sp.]|nr:hypothetical protein [Deltaproteobacteria bacterium]